MDDGISNGDAEKISDPALKFATCVPSRNVKSTSPHDRVVTMTTDLCGDSETSVLQIAKGNKNMTPEETPKVEGSEEPLEADDDSLSVNESSQSEANPPSDSFHTPSASIQNLATENKSPTNTIIESNHGDYTFQSNNRSSSEKLNDDSHNVDDEETHEEDIFQLSVDTQQQLDESFEESNNVPVDVNEIETSSQSKLYLDLSKFDKEGLSTLTPEETTTPELLLKSGFEEPSLIVISKSLTPATDLSISVDSNSSNGSFTGSSVVCSGSTTSVITGATVTRTGSSVSMGGPAYVGQNAGSNNKKVPGKKKMWYQQIFSTSYKTRSAEFKRIFKDLSSKERLIVDYACALQKEILVQGRMYVSQNYISFHANIFGWETQVSIRFKEIQSMTKEKTALVIPNAIQVSTEKDRYFFTSFVTRDATYMMLFKIWQSSLLEENMAAKEVWNLVHACYGEELGVEAGAAENEDFLACPLSTPVRPLAKASSYSNLTTTSDVASGVKSMEIESPQVGGYGDIITPVLTPDMGIPTSSALTPTTPVSPIHLENNKRIPTDLSGTSDSEPEPEIGPLTKEASLASLEIPPCPVDHSGPWKEVLNSVIPCDVDALFTMLFTNSKFFMDFHASRKTFDMIQSEWQLGQDGNQKVREISFTVTLSQMMGPRHAQVTESQVMLPCSQPGLLYAIDAESNNAGIPFADSFGVLLHFCLSRVSAQESRLIVLSQIKFKKTVWGAKGFIEKNTWAGIEDFYGHLEKALKEECSSMKNTGSTPSASPKPRRRHKKGMAPKPPPGSSHTDSLRRNGKFLGPTVDAKNTSLSHMMIESVDSSKVIGLIFVVLIALVALNVFLYVKVHQLEKDTDSSLFFPSQAFKFTETPQNHQEWLQLLQKQETLHRVELQKWHDLLMAALRVLRKAEADLEVLRTHVTDYSEEKLKPTYILESSKSEDLPSQNEKVAS